MRTLRALCTQAAHKPCHGGHWRRIVAILGSVAGRVVVCIGCVKSRVVRTRCRVVAPSYHDTKIISTQLLTSAMSHAHSAVSQRITVVLQRCIAALLRRIATPKVAPSHDTNYCIATHPMARPCTCTLPHAFARRPVMSWPLLVVSWGCVCDAPKPEGPLTTRKPAEYS